MLIFHSYTHICSFSYDSLLWFIAEYWKISHSWPGCWLYPCIHFLESHDLLVFGFVCVLQFNPSFAKIKKSTKLTLGGYLLKLTCLRKAQGARKWEVRATASFLLCIHFNHPKAVQTPVLVRAMVTSDRPEFQVVHLNQEWGWMTKLKEIFFGKTKPGKEQGGTRVSRVGECSSHLVVSDSATLM